MILTFLIYKLGITMPPLSIKMTYVCKSFFLGDLFKPIPQCLYYPALGHFFFSLCWLWYQEILLHIFPPLSEISAGNLWLLLISTLENLFFEILPHTCFGSSSFMSSNKTLLSPCLCPSQNLFVPLDSPYTGLPLINHLFLLSDVCMFWRHISYVCVLSSWLERKLPVFWRDL